VYYQGDGNRLKVCYPQCSQATLVVTGASVVRSANVFFALGLSPRQKLNASFQLSKCLLRLKAFPIPYETISPQCYAVDSMFFFPVNNFLSIIEIQTEEIGNTVID
jgi:hypothetical protein